MYLRKIRPRTTCLYSAASMLLRSLSAAGQSLASKPRSAPLVEFFGIIGVVAFFHRFFACLDSRWLADRTIAKGSASEKAKIEEPTDLTASLANQC